MKKTKTKTKTKKQDKAQPMYDTLCLPGVHVIAGKPATGKTSLATEFLAYCMKSQYPVACDNMDMQKKCFVDKLGKQLALGTKELISVIQNAERSNMFFYTEEQELTKLLPYLSTLRNVGARAAIIDFVQLLRVNGKPLNTDYIVAMLSAFANKLQMSIVLLCQLVGDCEDLYPYAKTIHILVKEKTNK